MLDAGKSRMIGLPYGEKNIAEKFNRLSRVHERHRLTTDTITVPLAEHNVVTFGYKWFNFQQKTACLRH